MTQDSFKILSEILVDLKHELSDLNAQIYLNRLQIRDAEERLRVFKNEESDDFKLFSPRSMSERFKEEIEIADSCKNEYEKKNEGLFEKREKLQNKIEKLEEIIKQENYDATVLSAQEEERQRIARDLHDTSLQNLIHLIHRVEICGMYIDEDLLKAKSELTMIGDGLKEVMREIRDIVFNLLPMPFENIGLKAALERLFKKTNERNDFKVVLDIDDVSCENEMILLCLYRIVQEGLSNIVKHSGADKIIFSCKVLNSVCTINLVDDGQGFNIEDSMKEGEHYGLYLMRERVEHANGKMNISSVRGEGTKIQVEIPI